MARSRKERRRTKARRSSPGATSPVTFRLPEMPKAVPKRDAGARADDGEGELVSLAALLPDVAPLRAPERVARAPGRSCAEAGARSSPAPGSAPAFVLEREGARVDGHRADCARSPVAPGWRRDWVPAVRVDLHGVRIAELERRLTYAIRECVRRSSARLLLIHGKGLHSAGGASVLAEAVVEILTSERHARHVRAFATAPDRLGGTGALAVELDLGRRK